MDEHVAVLDNWDEFCSSLDKKMVSFCTAAFISMAISITSNIVHTCTCISYRRYISRGKYFTKITFQPIHKENFLRFSSTDHY